MNESGLRRRTPLVGKHLADDVVPARAISIHEPGSNSPVIVLSDQPTIAEQLLKEARDAVVVVGGRNVLGGF